MSARMNLDNVLAKLEALEAELSVALREYFNEMDEGGTFFSMELDGRTHGDLRIEYKLGPVEYSSSTCKGAYARELPDEVAHRLGFNKRNEQKLLPKMIERTDDTDEQDTDIPI